jgi:hypothetical protein
MFDSEIPCVIRDRRAVMSAACHALLACEVEKLREGGDALHHLARVLIRHLTAHGVDLKVRRRVPSVVQP